MSKGRRITVAEYLTQQLNVCGKTQKEIAEEVKYDKPNIITMFKQGKTRVSINKVPAFAKALGVDEVHFLRLTMSEYMPETWEVIESVLGDSILSESERDLVKLLRETTGGVELGPRTQEEREEFVAMVEKWRKREEALLDAARRRVERESPHTMTTVPGK